MGHAYCDATEPTSIDELVRQLDHDQYAVRIGAVKALIASTQEDRSLNQKLIHCSRDRSKSVESLIAIGMIIDERNARRSERLLNRLRSAAGAFSEADSRSVSESIPGWSVWEKLLGSRKASRACFISIVDRYPTCSTCLGCQISRVPALTALLDAKSYDPRIDGDPAFWSLMIASRLSIPESGITKAARMQLDHRLSAALSRPRLRGRHVSRNSPQSSNDESLKQLVPIWLSRMETSIPPRTAIMIALQCGCSGHAEATSQQVLQCPDASPADLVTAMLTLAHEPIETLQDHFDDTRRAFQWQVLAEQKTVIDTQVRDVAIAIALDQSGRNLRLSGFQFVQADPLLGLRDDSLGFANNEDRDRVLSNAMDLLQNVMPPPNQPINVPRR